MDYEINASIESGVDSAAARRQWEDIVERVGRHADVTVANYADLSVPDLQPIGDLPAAVFCANHGVSARTGSSSRG